MKEDIKAQNINQEVKESPKPVEEKIELKQIDENSTQTTKPTETKIEDKPKSEDKPEIKTTTKQETTIKKTTAIVNAQSLPISTKHSIAVCNYIRGKNLETAILRLEPVAAHKKPIPMKGEIPHRKGKIMSGRFPIKAAKAFITILKSLKANAIANELEIEKYVLFCKANLASRPFKRFGRAKFKRTHVTLKLIKPIKKKKQNGKRK